MIGLAPETELDKNPEEGAFEAHNRRVWDALKEYYNVGCFC